MKKINLDTNPSCRLPLSSKGYEWFKLLERTIKTKKAIPEKKLDDMMDDLHGNCNSWVTLRDLDHFLLQLDKHGCIFRFQSSDLECIFWKRSKTLCEVIKILCTQDKRIKLINHKFYR